MVMLEPIRVLSETTANWLAGRGYACSAPAGRPPVRQLPQPFAGPALGQSRSEWWPKTSNGLNVFSGNTYFSSDSSLKNIYIEWIHVPKIGTIKSEVVVFWNVLIGLFSRFLHIHGCSDPNIIAKASALRVNLNLVCSLSSHRHLFIPLIFGSRFDS
jgi:hypothetical protein